MESNSKIIEKSKTQSRRSLESAPQLPAAASLLKTIRWGKKINGFPPRKEHAAVAVGNSVYSFGGFNFDGHPSYSKDVLDVSVLNVNEEKKQWKKLAVENGEVNLNQRGGHSAVVHNKFVIIFGGYVAKKKKLSNLTYRFNTETLKWDNPKVTGNIPDARQYHTAVVLKKEMFMYCGYGTTNDLHSLNLESFRWSTIETKRIPPSFRRDHSATVHNDRFMLIFSGWDYKEKKRVNTIDSFDHNSKTWTVVETRRTLPSSRSHHCAFVHNGRMYIFGGTNPFSFLNDVLCYDPETFEWEKVTPNGTAPSPREGAACVVLNDQVFIFGG